VSGARPGLPAFVSHPFMAVFYSVRGVGAGFRLSLSFRQETLVLAALCALLLWRGKPAADWLLCLGCWGLVMVVELINTAVEEALDLITTDYSVPVKNAKDMASAAVFFLLVFNAALWLFLFWNDLALLWS
jgi:diacylglycerol kinase (ATP)